MKKIKCYRICLEFLQKFIAQIFKVHFKLYEVIADRSVVGVIEVRIEFGQQFSQRFLLQYNQRIAEQ